MSLFDKVIFHCEIEELFSSIGCCHDFSYYFCLQLWSQYLLPFFFLLLVFIILSIQLCFVSQQHLDLFFAFCLPVFPSCVFDFFVLLSSCHFLYSWLFSIHSVSLANSIKYEFSFQSVSLAISIEDEFSFQSFVPCLSLCLREGEVIISNVE